MSPSSILNFEMGIKEFSNDERRNEYNKQNELVFYEVSEDSFLTLDLKNENSQGECPIYYDGNKIADSIFDFIKRMDSEPDYYIDIMEEND